MRALNPTGVVKSFGKGHRQDKQFQAQMEKVFASLYRQPKTMLMVSTETGIFRANICRYVSKWRKRNCVDIVKKDRCQISKHRASYLTTNRQLFPKSNQLKMFDV